MQPIGLLTLTGNPDELLRRDRAGRLPRRQPRAGHRRHRRPAAAGAPVLLPRHPAHPARRPELQPAADQPPARARSTTCSATACTRPRCTAASRPYRPNSLDGGCPFVAGDAEGAFVDVPQAVVGRRQGARALGLVRRPLQPGPAVLAEHVARSSRTTSCRRTPSSSASASTRRSASVSCSRLARIDAELAADVAAGLGMPAPDAAVAGRGRHRPARRCPRSGGTWPVDGRTVGVVVDATRRRGCHRGPHRAAARRRGWSRCCVAPTGGPVWPDRDLPAHRTLLTTRSVEFDAVVVAAAAATQRADARQSRDAKAGRGREPASTRGSPCWSTRRSGTARPSASSEETRMPSRSASPTTPRASWSATPPWSRPALSTGSRTHRAWDRFTASG